MVFSGEKRQPSDEQQQQQQMDRLKPLHNFDLPCLKWGNQKVLRCMKVDSKGDVAGGGDRKNSPETGLVIGTRRRDESERGFRSTDYNNNNNINNYKFSSSEKMKSVAGAGDGEIEATREKLMFDFQTEVGKMKDAILRGKFSGDSPPSTAATTAVMTSASPAEKPWNLRTRRAACKINNNNNNNNIVNGNCDDRKESFSPARIECNNNINKVVGDGGGGGDVITGTTKFSVSLSRRELEEDFTAMTGRRLPRKPKKRPRYIQKQLDTLFPGLWLSEITADLYRVPDDTDTGKR